MILSILQLVLIVRAALRSVTERFLFGIVGGVARTLLMVAGAYAAFRQTSILMLPGIHLTTSPGSPPSALSSALLLVVAVGGPLLSFALLGMAYARAHNVPAAQEEKLRRPFAAWLPVAILDALYIVIAVGAIVISEPP